MNILKSILFGLLLVAGACVLLFWAEGRAVKTARALEEGSEIVIEVPSDKVDQTNEGRLVHISGMVSPQDVPLDRRLGISADGAVRLIRSVEMYQWKEVSKDIERTGSDGGKTRSTVYELQKVWSGTPIDSSAFKSANAPSNPSMLLGSDRFDVGEVKVGAFRLAGTDIAGLGKSSPVILDDSGAAHLATAIGGGTPVWLHDNRFVLGADPEKAAIGDLRISYSRSDLDRLSAVGAQKAGRLTAYVTSNGREVLLIESGTASAADMFKSAIAGNTTLTWIIRIGGLILMFVGFLLSFTPLTGTLGRVPLIGPLIGTGASLVALVLTLLLGSSVIALGWIFYRPVLALGILAAGVVLAIAIGAAGRKKNPAQPAAPSQT